MNIWLLQTGETMPIGDQVRPMRTSLLARELAARGHAVTWWTSAFEHQRKTMVFARDTVVPLGPNLSLRVIRGTGYRRNVSLARYVDHAVVARKFRRQAERENKPDIIVASLPCHQLAHQAVEYARDHGIPVIVDVRDLWPEVFLSPVPGPAKGLARGLLRWEFARTHRALAGATGLVAVSQGYLDWAVKNANRARSTRDAVFFHGYRKQPADASADVSASRVPAWLRGRETAKVFAFVGTFGVSYELNLVLQVAERVARVRPDALFVVGGTGQQTEALARQAAQLPNVILPGWIDANEIRELLAQAYAGLVPCKSVDDTLPNKPFEYLASGLPLISSLEGEMRQLIDHYGLGMNYRVGDVEGLYAAVMELLEDPARRESISINARRFAATQGNADVLYAAYANHIEVVAAAHAESHGS